MIMSTASGMMEFEGQNNDFGGTKRYNNIPLVPPNSFGPPTMVAVVVDFKDRALFSTTKNMKFQENLNLEDLCIHINLCKHIN